MCEQQYFMEYVLGHRSPSNKKADKGTIVHKILEILAGIRQSEQNNQTYYVDDILDKIDIYKYNLDNIIDSVYNYYIAQFKHHEWEPKDLKDCRLWTNKAITDHDGIFDPRSRNIVQPEQRFDIVINKPWAKYAFETQNGPLEGNLAIKGTVDLITKVNDSTLEVIDWKTGRRLDWATGKEKTWEKLYRDPQLLIYYYALSALYPEYDNIIMSINFINDGGAFSLCFNKNDIDSAENLIRKKFEEIRNCKKPKLSKSWKCTKLCHFGKSSFDNPMIEYRGDKLIQIGKPMTKCEQIKHDTDHYGINPVVDMYTREGYNVGQYKPPGSVE